MYFLLSHFIAVTEIVAVGMTAAECECQNVIAKALKLKCENCKKESGMVLDTRLLQLIAGRLKTSSRRIFK